MLVINIKVNDIEIYNIISNKIMNKKYVCLKYIKFVNI